MDIQFYEGCRHELLSLFRMADESESQILSYYELGNILVARERGVVVGMALVVRESDTIEIVSLAVVPERQGEGIAKGLIAEAEKFCVHEDIRRLIVCTGSWETENIAFYLRRGFRIFNVVRDFFSDEKGYALDVRDQIQFEKNVSSG